jgi:hypothetical protein
MPRGRLTSRKDTVSRNTKPKRDVRGRSIKGAGTGDASKRPQDALPKIDETVVRETDRTVDVKPVRQSRKAREPMPEPALDHRRQIVGTDEPKGRTRR